jgi:hypothetical protein
MDGDRTRVVDVILGPLPRSTAVGAREYPVESAGMEGVRFAPIATNALIGCRPIRCATR